MPTMNIKISATTFRPGDNTSSCDIYGIPFVLDNSATTIIKNERILFTSKFTLTTITLETADGLSTNTKLVGVICLLLSDNSNEPHV